MYCNHVTIAMELFASILETVSFKSLSVSSYWFNDIVTRQYYTPPTSCCSGHVYVLGMGSPKGSACTVQPLSNTTWKQRANSHTAFLPDLRLIEQGSHYATAYAAPSFSCQVIWNTTKRRKQKERSTFWV